MTMFGKGNWTIFSIPTEENGFSENLLKAYPLMPVMAKYDALSNKSNSMGITPFSEPRMGDSVESVQTSGKNISINSAMEFLSQSDSIYDSSTGEVKVGKESINLVNQGLWSNDISKWELTAGVYAFWLVDFQWDDVHDLNSKKEALAYSYGSPFKFQPADAKATITEEAEKLDTITRKQYQVIVDFNRGRAWVNSPNKEVVGNLIPLMESFGCPLGDFRPEADYGMGDPGWAETFLDKLYSTSEYKSEFTQRANDIRMHGVKGVEPSSSSFLEKILKSYYAFSPVDPSIVSERVGLGGPLCVRLAPTVASTISLKTPYEATEVLATSENILLSSTSLTYCSIFEKTTGTDHKPFLVKNYSVDVSSITSIPELPGFVVKGLSIENFKRAIKQEVKALERPLSITEYWHLWYNRMDEALFNHLNTVKDIMGM